VFAYASGPFVRTQPDPYREYQREVDQYLSLNFKAIKPRGGVEPRADGIMANALRRQVGPDIGIMVDINQGYTAAAAIRAAKFMEGADLLWIEEPVQLEDIPGYQSFARATAVATAGGEALGSVRAFRDFLAAGTFDILQPDLSICGGYSGFRQIWALAQA
jgi:D-galactarolactone cycloisomerase